MKKIAVVLLSNVSSGAWFALCLVVVMLTGCSKAKPTSVEPPTTQNVQQAEQDHMPVPAAAPAKAPVVVAQPNAEPDLAELNRAMIRWLMANRRKPANFEDFAATAGVVIPPPPAGKKYIVASDMHIKLVNR